VADSLAAFGTDTLDLVLLHYPRCFPGVCTGAEIRQTEAAGGWRESWRALAQLAAAGTIKARGVSNFDVAEVELMDPPPLVVQNWFDPFRQDRDMVAWCAARGVAYTSYSTLGGQWEHQQVEGGGGAPRSNPVFDSPVLRRIADTHAAACASSSPSSSPGGNGGGGDGVAAADMVPLVVLSWALQRGVLVLPRSSSPSHIHANARLLKPHVVPVFLSQAELEEVDALDGALDTHAECGAWAAAGECAANPGYMLHGCHASCGVGTAAPLRCDGRPMGDDGDDGMMTGEL
jgi:alcohol dehydrogenase (NADP+)